MFIRPESKILLGINEMSKWKRDRMKWRDDTITKAYAFSVANTYIRRSCILDTKKNIIDIVYVTNRICNMDIIKHLLTLYVSRR